MNAKLQQKFQNQAQASSQDCASARSATAKAWTPTTEPKQNVRAYTFPWAEEPVLVHFPPNPQRYCKPTAHNYVTRHTVRDKPDSSGICVLEADGPRQIALR